MIAHLLTHALQTRGYTVHVIADGMTAMADLAAERPKIRARVILLDISLPGMDGLSVLQMLAQRGITRTSTVIMLTARATEAEMLQALGAGAQDYVTKPFSLPVLMQRLDRSLNARG